MSDFEFLNVYSGCSPQNKGSSETFLWNVYLNNKENVYLIQKLDENNNPTSEKYKISPTFFGVNFRKVNDVQQESKTKKNIIFIRSKDKTDDLNKDSSSVFTTVKNEKSNKKKTGEFLVQLSANKPQAIQKKSDEAPKSTLSAKKTTNEFQLNVTGTPQKKTNVNDFGLSSLLNTVVKSNKKESSKATLTLSDPGANTSRDTKPAADTPSSVSAQTPPPVAAAQHTGNIISVKTPAASETSNQSEQNKKIEKPAQDNSTYPFINSTADKQPAAAKETASAVQARESRSPAAPAKENAPAAAESTRKDSTQKENTPKDRITETEEALLKPKDSGKDFQLSEKALKLDISMRAEFQVSLTHWNSAKKNLAKRHFNDILTRPGNYVPAHKHMFTDFAIKLRKINLIDLALQYAAKSTTLSPDDSHAFFNVARLYYELGRYEEANEFIDKALELENDLKPALRLSAVIKECIRRKAKNR